MEEKAPVVLAFNKEVGNSGWTSARGVYLTAGVLIISFIGDADSLSLSQRVKMGVDKVMKFDS